MSHHKARNGRPVVECDDPVRDPETGAVRRCGRKTQGRRLDTFARTVMQPIKLGLFDLPDGWSVAPFPADYDHGKVRRNLLDGSPIPPLSWEVGIVGDLHTCPTCRRGQR